jgi:diacylglycerol kinase family enzyme
MINPRSGDGKAERTGLVQACLDRGIEPVVLSPGDDLSALAHGALDRGADVIGMAGGDGSQAIVASAASARGVPMVVVPSGTRNHFALDLGLDADDVIGALDAYGEAAERTIDLGELNGRTFVNNGSLGLYATIVRSPAYRDAKVETALSTLPSVLGPGTEPFDLTYAGPDGTKHHGAHLIQVSNNPYRRSLTAAGRPRLDTHRLGVIVLVIDDERRFLTALAEGRPARYEGLSSWTTDAFEVGSSDPVDVGLDGEALFMDPPLQFSIRPSALRVRLPLHSYGRSPADRTPSASAAFRGVWRVAKGEDVSE